jgi:hypothetical protein
MVRDMVVGNRYKVNGSTAVLQSKTIAGRGGSGSQEPYYELIFESGDTIIRDLGDWAEKYEEVTGGGKRKTRYNKRAKRARKTNKRSRRH